MRDLPIAYGNSCYAKTWANKTTTWEDLCERLKTTIRTTESVEEYPKLKKDDRDRAKDKGCLLYTSPSPRDRSVSRMPSSA